MIKNGKAIRIGSRTRLVLDDGEVREFDVCFKTVKRTKVKTFEGFEPETTDVAITGVFFCWEGYDLLPCVDENGVSDVTKMEVIQEPEKGIWLDGDNGLKPYLRMKDRGMPHGKINQIAWLLLNGSGCGFCEVCRDEPCNIKDGEKCTTNIADYIRECVRNEDSN